MNQDRALVEACYFLDEQTQPPCYRLRTVHLVIIKNRINFRKLTTNSFSLLLLSLKNLFSLSL